MADSFEAASGDARRIGDFPRWWGTPQGTPQSEERLLWISYHVAYDQGAKARGVDPAAGGVRGHVVMPIESRCRDARAALARVTAAMRS